MATPRTRDADPSTPEPVGGTGAATPSVRPQPSGAATRTTTSAAGTKAAETAAGPDLLALDRQVCFALAVASRTVVSIYRPLLEPMGLTHPQYLVMLALWEAEPLRVSEIADRLSLEPATLSPLLKRLEAGGLVVRRRDPDDERAVAVTLTPAGRALRARAELVPPAVIARLGMDLPELEELRDRLTKVIAAARDAG